MPKEAKVSGYLYTVYRNPSDEIVAFECPARVAAKIMGITRHSFFRYASQPWKYTGYTIIKSTGLEEVMAWDDVAKMRTTI